jgi:hypothetical protein
VKFLFGTAIGALGMWAYQSKVQRANAPEIAIPSSAEVYGRPSEPLPGQQPERVQITNA